MHSSFASKQNRATIRRVKRATKLALGLILLGVIQNGYSQGGWRILNSTFLQNERQLKISRGRGAAYGP
jgi:hypothetical protein